MTIDKVKRVYAHTVITMTMVILLRQTRKKSVHLGQRPHSCQVLHLEQNLIHLARKREVAVQMPLLGHVIQATNKH